MKLSTRQVPVLAITLLLFGLSYATCVLVRHLETERIQTQFSNDAGEHINLIEGSLQSGLAAVESLAAFHGNAGDPDRRAFRNFVSVLQSRWPAVQAWEWVPRVPASRRAEIESRALGDGCAGFAVRQWGAAAAASRPAGDRDEFFPVYFVEPLNGNEVVLGCDLGVEPTRRRALDAARDSGRMAATGRINLIQDVEHQAGFLVFVPVYRGGSVPPTEAERQAGLLGFATIAIRTRTLVEQALRPLVARDLRVRLIDETPGVGRECLCDFNGRYPNPTSRPAPTVEAAAFSRSHALNLAGRTWLVVCDAPLSYIQERRTGQAGLALAIGVVMSLLVGVALWGMQGRNRRIEFEVQTRTRELSQSNRQLASEVAERQKAEAVLARRERETRTLLDALPGYAFFKDANGAYRTANEAFLRAVGCFPEPIAGKTDHDLVPASLAARYRRDDRIVCESGQPLEIEEEPFLVEGRETVVATRKVPLKDEGGRVLGLIGLGFDITRHKAVERTLQEERDLFVAGPVVVMRWGLAEGWPVEYVSANVESQFGYTPAELTSGHLAYATLIHAEDLPRVRQHISDQLRGGNSFFEQEYRVRHKSGAVRWVYDFTAVLRDGSGQPLAMRGYLLDIEARRHLEESLRKSREQLEFVLEGNQDGLWDWNILTGEVQCSERWAGMLGYSLTEIQPSVAFWEKLVHPEDRPAVFEALRRHLEGETPQYESEHRLLSKSGEWIWVLDRGRVVKRGPNGRPERAAGTHTDITRRRQAQHELITLRHAVEQSMDGLLVADVDGRIRFVNRACAVLHGFAVEELAGKPVTILCSPREADSGARAPAHAAVSGDSWAGEDVHLRKDGTEVAVWVTRSCLCDERSGVIGIVMTVRDITLAKQAEAAARQNTAAVTESLRRERAATDQARAADRAKSEFLANMNHEIRSPLTAIIGYIDMLSRATLGDADRTDCYAQVRRSARHLLGLINDVLDLSKIEAGQMKLNLEPCLLPRLIEDVCGLFRPQAEEKAVGLAVSWESGTPETIETDSVRLKQILANLVGNAVKFTDYGTITVLVRARPSAAPGGTRLAVSVADTGIGIPRDRLGAIFSPFVQAHDRTVRDYGGTGLGLAISRHLATQLGGGITAESEPGQGSTFTLDLPAAVPARGHEPAPVPLRTPRPGRPSHSLQGVRILVVDDNPENQRIIRFMLEELRARVTLAADGEQGVNAVLQAREAGQPFDLILLDMRMPVLDGYATATRLREMGIPTPIIALTAYALADDESRCLAAGCDAYVSKPLDPPLFWAVLERQLQASGHTLELPASAKVPPASSPKVPSPDQENGSDPARERLVSRRAGDPRFWPVLQRYLQSLPPAIAELEAANGQNVSNGLRTTLHRLAGTGTMYGLPTVSEAARSCESALASGHPAAELEAGLKRLAAILRSLEMPGELSPDAAASLGERES